MFRKRIFIKIVCGNAICIRNGELLIMNMLFESLPVLNSIVQSEPGFIMQPLGTFFGFIIDMIMRGITFIFTPVNALGFSIIVITLIVRGALIPQQIKMQRNSAKTRAIKPEMDKIREKYGNTRDPELRRKMAAEVQALNQKHGINMIASCLPLLVTMPIFIALFGVFGRAFHFIPSINEVYTGLANEIIALPGYVRSEVFENIVLSVIPDALRGDFSGPTAGGFLATSSHDWNRVIHVLTTEHWEGIFANLRAYFPEHLSGVYAAYNAKLDIEVFFGLNLVTISGWALPGIIIPILSAGTMAFQSWQMSRLNPATDQQQKIMQYMMMLVMPLLFGWFTVNASSAVGLYWVMGNVFLITQNFIVYKFFPHKIGLADAPAK